MRLAFFTIAALILFAGCKENYPGQFVESTTEKPIQAVKIAQLKATDEPMPIEAGGIVASEAEMNLSFKIGGVVQAIYVEEGQSVKKGQLLAKLNPTEIDAQVLKATRAVEKAKRDLARIEQLYQDTAATLENVQDLTTAMEVAEADLKIAEFNRTYSRIVAPAKGRILRRFVEGNELVGPGNPLFRMATDRQKSFIIKIGVSDRDVLRLRANDPAEVKLDAHPGEIIKAYVSEIAEAADPRTGTFEIELTLNPGQLALKNGFIGKVKILPSAQEPYYKISMDALVEGQEDRVAVYVPDTEKSKVNKRKLRPSYIGDDFFAVPADQLPEDSWVVTEGAAYLREGADIKVIN